MWSLRWIFQIFEYDFADLASLENRLLEFQSHYEKIAKPFEWKFTKEDLKRLLSNLSDESLKRELAVA